MRRTLSAAAAGAALLAGAACGSPTEPGRPAFYSAVFLGTPPGAESFTPRAVEGRRVYGVASAGGQSWAAVWSDGAFATLLDPPAGCRAVPVAARRGAVVGQVTCAPPGEAAAPSDAYGWGIGGGVPAGRVAAEPHGFRGVSNAGVVGTLYPRPDFPAAPHRAFLASAGGAVEVLLPPGAQASAAAGIADDGTLAVTALSACAAAGCAESRAAVRARDGTWTILSLPSNAERASAVAVSSAGHVLVHAAGGAEQPYVRFQSRDRLLPVVPGTRVVLEGVNARGQVVGTGVRSVAVPGRGQSEGLLWGGGRQYFLRERILLRDWDVTSAHAIDDQGFVAAMGTETATGRSGAILLVPAGR